MPGLIVADDLKAPACDPKTKGVMWNFGTDEKPDVRRCDGISYIPFSVPCSERAVLVPAAPAADPAKVKQDCNDRCDSLMRNCFSDCPGIVDADCKSRCQRARGQCLNKC